MDEDGFTLNVAEIFPSIQGEGIHTGMPSVFVRLAGCALECVWCDTPAARDPAAGRSMGFNTIRHEISTHPCINRVCLTGGEPLDQANTKMFVQMLLNEGYHVDLETNGAHYLGDIPHHENLSVSMDVKTPSSGMRERTRLDNIGRLGPGDQMKFIIAGEEDLEYAASILRRHSPVCQVVLTPEGGRDMGYLVEAVKGQEAWKEWPVRLLPQLHKMIWGDRPGV